MVTKNGLKGRTNMLGHAIGKVADSEKVDRLESNQFMRSATHYHRGTSTFSVVAPGAVGDAALAEIPVATKVDRPEGRSLWVAVASETAPYESEWAVRIHAVCVLQTQSYAYPAVEDVR